MKVVGKVTDFFNSLLNQALWFWVSSWRRTNMAETLSRTLPHLFLEQAGIRPSQVMQYSKRGGDTFIPTTYESLRVEICVFAAGLLELGVKRGDRIGLIADNRREWLISDFAILGLGAIDVPRGCDATEQEIAYILAFSGCDLAILENEKQLDKILARKSLIPGIHTVILMDPPGENAKKIAEKEKLKVFSFEEVSASGSKRYAAAPDEYAREAALGKSEDLATIIYTSGTTGEPKGVMLSHRNFMHQIDTLPKILCLQPAQTWLSVLPVWHSFERLVEYALIGAGATMAYSKPIGAIMLPDFQAIKPQWMASVPRIWESVQEGIYRNIRQQGGIKLIMFTFFVSVGRNWAYFRNKLLGRLPDFGMRSRAFDILSSLLPLLFLLGARGLGELLVFRKIKQKLGGKFIAGVSGGGAMPPAVDHFFDALGIKILEGYGLTETAPVVAVRSVQRPVLGTVGAPLPGTEFRIVDDEGKVLGIGKKGNIQIRGPQVMMGYYRKPDLTQAVLQGDGWLKSGDIGMLGTGNELKITGRAKDTIVLRGGENIEPVPLEHRLAESMYIKGSVVLGQDKKFLAALIIPDQDSVTAWAKENGVPFVDYESLLAQPEVKELINFEINQLVNPKSGFKPFERIFCFALLAKPFVVDRELSAKQEIKRHAIADIYKHEIARLFKE